MIDDDTTQTAQLADKETDVTDAVAPVKTYDLEVPTELVALVKDEPDESELRKHIGAHLKKLITKHGVDAYRTVLLYDPDRPISQFHSDRIYDALSGLAKTSDILMVLVSDGGKIEPAYLISKTCKRLSKKFVVVIPRRAKSAATLISLGASEIHMGLLSELGPIDPQFGGFPALGLANALEKIASLSTKFPAAAEMFAKYLTANLDIKDLGYFERINESAAQYAQRLLEGKSFPEGRTPESLADHLTNHYKDHAFVIDVDEASRLLGKSIVKENSKEYDLANEMYVFLDFAGFLFRYVKKKDMRYVGTVDSGLDLYDIKGK
jgi:hypothetical protein